MTLRPGVIHGWWETPWLGLAVTGVWWYSGKPAEPLVVLAWYVALWFRYA